MERYDELSVVKALSSEINTRKNLHFEMLTKYCDNAISLQKFSELKYIFGNGILW